MIYLGEMKEKIFYEVRDMDDYNSNKEYYRTFPFEIRTKNEIFKKINLFDKEYLQGFEPSIWELKFPINSVLQKISEIDKFNYNAFCVMIDMAKTKAGTIKGMCHFGLRVCNWYVTGGLFLWKSVF